jgi:hypothetical protein
LKGPPPFGNKVWHTTSNTGGIVKGIQEFSTVRKVACTVILSQSLIYRKSRAINGSRGREQTTRGGTETREEDMLNNVILRPPAIRSFNILRRRRHGEDRMRGRSKVWPARVHICRRIQDVPDETISTNECLYSFIPRKKSLFEVRTGMWVTVGKVLGEETVVEREEGGKEKGGYDI